MKRQDDQQARSTTVALVGNPNVGKSTFFNTMTGCRRHTGNWAGKTLDCAQGLCRFHRGLRLVDLPGMYAWHQGEGVLPEEAEAIAYLESNEADAVAVICDAGALERNLVLVLQLLERIHLPLVVVVNLCAEAKAHGVEVDGRTLQECLGVPVFCVEAHDKKALADLAERLVVLPQSPSSSKEISSRSAAEIAALVSHPTDGGQQRRRGWEELAERMLTGKWSGYCSILLLLSLLLWLTMVGANVLSEWLSLLLVWAEAGLWRIVGDSFPVLADFLIGGVVRTVFWVVGVMLPPMAIFFPLFGALEDLGVLPRMAFVLDRPFARCRSCGKQALTMCMGLGCNSVGVTGCRIIDSPRERKVAMLTNTLIPCNGRLPTLSILVLLFFVAGSGFSETLTGTLFLLLFLLLGVGMTLLCSSLLSRTILRGEPSAYLLELPPFRLPRFGQLLLRSVLDRTLKILWRAVAVSAPAGAILWLLTHLSIAGNSIAFWVVNALSLPATWIGLDGVVLTAFLLSFPANELFLPIVMMLYQGGASMEQIGNYRSLGEVLVGAGWTTTTALCCAVFVLFHWPCATTLLTVQKESRSAWLTFLAAILPTICGCLLCALITLASKINL